MAQHKIPYTLKTTQGGEQKWREAATVSSGMCVHVCVWCLVFVLHCAHLSAKSDGLLWQYCPLLFLPGKLFTPEDTDWKIQT